MKAVNPRYANPYKEFAQTHSLVYSSKHDDDAHEIVRGITLDTHRHDRYIVQGNVDGLDITLLSRSVEYKKPHTKSLHLDWSILKVNLPGGNLPHVFLDGNNRYHEDIYENIFTKFHNLILAPAPKNHIFFTQYRVFCSHATIPDLTSIFTDEALDQLNVLGHYLDYEITGESLFVYLPKSVENVSEINNMLKSAMIINKSLLA